jgi:hypothetical protein
MEAKADTEEDFHSADSGSDSDSYQKKSPDAKGPKSTKSSPSAPAPPKKRQVSSTKTRRFYFFLKICCTFGFLMV